MDGGEYEKIVESSRKDPGTGTESLRPPEAIREESYQPRRVSCPKSVKSLLELEPIHFEFIHHVIVTDQRYDCDGVWFDALELSLMFEYMKKEDEALSTIAKKEISDIREERELRERDEILDGEKTIDRRTFWRVLFGLNIKKY